MTKGVCDERKREKTREKRRERRERRERRDEMSIHGDRL
jgi:hypothetical protein